MVLDVLIFGTAAQIPANSGRKIWEEMDFVGFVKKGLMPDLPEPSRNPVHRYRPTVVNVIAL